jgi:hypothetical protein
MDVLLSIDFGLYCQPYRQSGDRFPSGSETATGGDRRLGQARAGESWVGCGEFAGDHDPQRPAALGITGTGAGAHVGAPRATRC